MPATYLYIDAYGDMYPVRFQREDSFGGTLSLTMLTEADGEWLPSACMTVDLMDEAQSSTRAYLDVPGMGADCLRWIEANGIGRATGEFAPGSNKEYPLVEFARDFLEGCVAG